MNQLRGETLGGSWCETKVHTDNIFRHDNSCRSVPIPSEDYVDTVIGNKAIEYLENRPAEKPFYMMVSFCGPHMPFDAPKEWLDKVPYEEVDDFTQAAGHPTLEEKKELWKKRRAYKAMLLLIDDQIGRILSYLEENNLSKETMVVLTADHGEMLGDRGLIGKSVPWKEASTVPLAIYHPDCPKGKMCNEPVSLLDVAATILDAAGIDRMELRGQGLAYSSRIPSVSLLPVVKGEEESIREYTFTEFDKLWHMLRTKEWKYVRRIDTNDPDVREEELFDLTTDEREQRNVAALPENQDILEWFRRRREFVLDNTQAIQTSWARDYLNTI